MEVAEINSLQQLVNHFAPDIAEISLNIHGTRVI